MRLLPARTRQGRWKLRIYVGRWLPAGLHAPRRVFVRPLMGEVNNGHQRRRRPHQGIRIEWGPGSDGHQCRACAMTSGAPLIFPII